MMKMTGFPSVVVLSLLLLFVVSVSTQDVSYKDVDCGWVGIVPEDCKANGCVWLPNFPGPWCQKPDSPYIPSMFDFGFSYMSNEQRDLFNISAVSLVIIIASMVFSTKKFLFINPDLILVGVFLLLGAVTRYYIIEHPREIVFDEFYFGKFANMYCNEVFVFDIHPPLAKLTHWFVGSLMGQTCDFEYENGIGSKYDYDSQFLPYRRISAFFGTLVVPLSYMVGRRFKLSKEASIFLACLVLCDPLLLSETRLILTDSQLYFYIVLSIYCALRLWDSPENSRERDFWTVATAVSSGCAFCVKFTALATLGWIGFATFLSIYSTRAPIGLTRCLVASVIAAVVFAFPFYFHFKRAVNSGSLDWNVDPEHKALLKGSYNYDSNAARPSFISHLIYTIKRMLEQNAASLGDHPYASYWYEWIVGSGALLSYSEHIEEDDWHGHIFIFSSVYICYAILIGIGLFLTFGFGLIRIRTTHTLNSREVHFIKTGFLLFLGWVANLLPYALVARTTYSYHHLPAQFFGMIILSLVFDELPFFFFSLFLRKKELNTTLHRFKVVVGSLFLFGLFWQFWYYSCFVYGYGLNNIEYSKRKWAVSAI